MRAFLFVVGMGSLATLCVAGSASHGMGDEELGLALAATDFPAERIATNVDTHATAELIAEKSALNPGETAWIGVRFKVADGWHLYWNGRNDTGTAPGLETKVPAGYSLGAWVWPAPQRHVSPGEILDHVYEGTVLLMAPLSVPASATPGTSVSVSIEATWVVCDSHLCMAESAALHADFAVKAATEPSASAKEFDTARARQPKAWPADSKSFAASIASTAAHRTATIRVEGATRLEFYPLLEGAEPVDLLTHGVVSGEKLALRLHDGERGQGALRGVVAVARNGKEPSEFYSVVIGDSPATPEGKQPGPAKEGTK